MKVIVIGAGPAGMMAAGAAAENGADVTIIEKNQRVGRKLAITGKGRCNITNFCDNETFIAHVTANPRFLYSAINRFSCYDTVAFFEERGLATKVERGNRVFPASDHSSDVIRTLEQEMKRRGVEVRLSAHVTAVSPVYGSAMKNSDDTLLAAAKIVTASDNNAAGVGKTIMSFLNQ